MELSEHYSCRYLFVTVEIVHFVYLKAVKFEKLERSRHTVNVKVTISGT